MDVRRGSWDLIIADLQQSQQTKARVLRPVFVGKMRDEIDALWMLRQYFVHTLVVDSRPEAELAIRLQESARKHGIMAWRAEYATNPVSAEMTLHEDAKTVKLDRSTSLDRVRFNFQLGQNIVLPQNYKELNSGEFAAELCSSVRMFKSWGGRESIFWENAGPDHAFHAMNYLITAFRLSGMEGWATSETMAPSLGIVESALEHNIMEPEEGDAEDGDLVAPVSWLERFGVDLASKGGNSYRV